MINLVDYSIDLIVLSVLLTIAIYHLLIFIKRKNEPEEYQNLYLVGYSFGLILYILFSDYSFLKNIIHNEKIFDILRPMFAIFCLYTGVNSVSSILCMDKYEKKAFKIPYLIITLCFFISLSQIFIDINKYGNIIRILNSIIALISIVSCFFIHISYVIKNKIYKTNKKIIGNLLLLFLPPSIIFITFPLISRIYNIPHHNIMPIILGLSAFNFAYIFSEKFNNEYYSLKELTNNLEKKVIERTKALEQANKQKTDAFINISHEIKTPLTIISNHLDKHIKKYKNTEELEIVSQNVNKLKRDIKNVLDFEKLEKDMPHYDHSQIADLSGIVERNIFQFKEIADRKGINLKFNISPNIYSKIDPSSFDSITINLIGNAIKFTEISGEINANLKADNKEIELIISDTGIGISKEMQKNIFKPYYQVSHKKSNIQGIGMGLNIVKKIIDKLEGQIFIDSQLGKGTTFKITLKRYFLKDNDKIQTYSSSDNVISDESGNIKLKEEKYDKEKKTILIVEDNLQMLSSLQNDLEPDYNIFYAFNGKEALEKIKNIPKPDIIISDIMMDIMDGYEFYTELLKDDSFKSVPFIFLTAKGSEDDKISGLQKGAVDYITKPFNIEELKAKLCSLLKVQEALNKERLDEITRKITSVLESNNILPVKDKNEIIEDKNETIEKYGISRKQAEVFSLLEKGFERKEIADILKIDFSTVKTHIERMFKKLNVNNKIDLINTIRKSK